MPDRISLQSNLPTATLAQRSRPRWRKHSRAEWEEILDPCKWREPVYAWLLANWEKVAKARTSSAEWNRMEWKEIARIMELEGVKGSRGEPPNANSVRRVWGRVVRDLEEQEAREDAQKAARKRRCAK